MLLHSLYDIDGSQCVLAYEETDGWLRATWRGHVDPQEAQRGAAHYLISAELHRSPRLLNDNVGLVGSWFDSVQWLEQVWLPQAQHLGLRCIAHVVQADTHADILTLTFPQGLVGQLDLQLFYDVAEAEAWLRTCD